MATDRPLVSVLAAAYNHAEFLEEMAGSVLGQTVGDLELLVVDDGSTDDTAPILRKLAGKDQRLRILRHPGGVNRGVGASTVLAAREARGDVLALIDADDRWNPRKLARQLEGLTDGVTLSYGRARCVDPSGERLPTTLGRPPSQFEAPPLEEILRGNFIPKLTAMFPGHAYRRAGGVEPSQPFEDYDLWMRLICLGELAFTDEVLAEYRLGHGGRDLRHLEGGWDFRGTLQAVDHLLRWAALPSGAVDIVRSWNRAYRAVTDLIDGFGARGLAELRLEDALRLAALLRERAGRLPSLVTGGEIQEWCARLAGLGGEFHPVLREVERQLAVVRGPAEVPSGRRFGGWRRRRAMANAGEGVTGYIDEPTPDRVVRRGKLRVRGWALDDGRVPDAVLIRAGGVVRAVARIGLPRPDVADAYPGSPQSGHSGWMAEVDLGEERGDAALIQVVILRANGVLEPLGEMPVRLLGGLTLPVGEITHPRSGGRLSGDTVRVTGWALCASSPISRVDVLVDGQPVGPAGLGRPTPEVFDAVPLPAAAVSGFELLLEPVGATGELRIGAVAHTLNGASVELPEVRVEREQPPVPPPPSRARSADTPRARGPGGDLRLVFFTHALEPTGASLCLSDLVRSLAARAGVSCYVIASEDGPLRDELERAGAMIHISTSLPHHDPAAFEGRVAELGRWVEGGSYDVAVVNSVASFGGVHVAQRANIPAIWIVHEGFTPPQFLSTFYPAPGPHPQIQHRFLEAFSEASIAVFQAEETRREYLKSVEPRLSATLPYGIDTRGIEAFRSRTDRKSVRIRLGLPEDATVVFYPGRLEPRRSQALLVQAIDALRRSRSDLFVVLLGDVGGPYSKAVANYVHGAGLDRRILVLPEQRDTFEWYACADVVVSLPDIGSLPRTVVEALAFDLPVASSSVGGVPALLSEVSSGELCEPNDLGDTIRALDSLLTRRARSGRGEGASLVRERHDLERYGDRCLELIRELSSRGTIGAATVNEILEA